MMESETLREVTASLTGGEYHIVSTLKEGRLYLAEKAKTDAMDAMEKALGE